METTFFRLLAEQDKAVALLEEIHAFRCSEAKKSFTVDPDAFSTLPACAFIYWVDEATRARAGALSL